MSLFVVKRNAGALARLGQYGLAERQSGKGGGIEGGERMERIALEASPLGCRHHEAVIEGGVVGHDNGAATVVLLHPLADPLEDLGQRLFFRDSSAQRVEGIDTGELQSRFFQIGTFERLHMKMENLIGQEPPLLIHFQGISRDFEQGIGFGVEAGCFNIDDDGVKTTKTALEGMNCVGHGISVSIK